MDGPHTLHDLKAVHQQAKWLSTPHLAADHRGPTTQRYVPLPGPLQAKPFVQALLGASKRWPDLIAISSAKETMSYSELWRSVQKLAGLIKHEYPGSEPIGILLPSGPLYVVAVFACLAAGRMSVLLDEGHPAGRNHDIAAATGITLLLAKEMVDARLVELDVDVSNIQDIPDTNGKSPLLADSMLGFDDPAFILCTSGSTGRPKAIVHSQATMFHWARTTHNALHVRHDDRALSLSSMASLGGFTSLLSYPLAGACQEMLDIKTQGLSGLLETLSTRPVTILRTAPSLLRLLCSLPEAATALSRLRIVQTFGEPLTRADTAMIRQVISPACLIRTTYGATECSGLSWFVEPSEARHPVFEPAGVLMPDTEAAIVDENDQACVQGEAGELLIRSRYNALGEWINGRIAPGRLQPDLFDPSVRIYRTGDIARVDAEGVFVVLGRKDRMIKINGQRVEPAEIEAVLREHGEVLRAEMIVDDRTSSRVLLAFVIPTSDAKPDLAGRLKTILRSQLPTYMMPSKIVLLPDMPLLPGGKVDGLALLQCCPPGRSRPDERD